MATTDTETDSTSAAEPVRFNPLVEGFVDSPYEQYAALRAHDPVHYSDLLCGWVVTRFDDVGRLLRDPSVSSNVNNATPTPLTINELERLADQKRASGTVVLMDDPDHARVRRLMADPFRPREIERLRESVAQRVDAAIDRLAATYGDGTVEFDLFEEFAYPLPVEIFSAMLGLPEEEHPQFRHWTQCVARTMDPIMSATEREVAFAGLDDMCAYMEEQAERKRIEPCDDLLTHLVHAEEEGEVLSHEELIAQLVTLYMAGHEPTAGLIGMGMVALMKAPDQLGQLRADRGLLKNALSELLRYDGPNQFVRRITTQPTLVGGVELPAGAVIYASPASANRDEARWGDTADKVVVNRSDASQHLQFGAGIHACLGSHLARLQAEVAFAAILDRLDHVDFAGEPVWSTRMFIRGMRSLPISCTIKR